MSTYTLPGTPSSQPLNTLTPEQWQGLGRLADWVVALDPLTRGPTALATVNAVTGLAQLYARYDLAHLAEETLGALQALSDSGLLAMLRDNAASAAQSLQLFAPVLEQITAYLKRVPLDQLKADLTLIHQLLSKLRALSTFVDEHVADDLSVAGARLGEALATNDPGAALSDALATLEHLRANGTLTRITEWSDLLSQTQEAFDWAQLIGQAQTLPWHKLGELVQGINAALDEAGKTEETSGGVRGLLALMRDPQVQHGLRTLALLTRHIQNATQD